MRCRGIICLVLIYFFCIPALDSSIVINEVCYDPLGADDFHEWIEFYNNGTTDVNLVGWRLYSGGAEFTVTFTFPYFILRPQRYLLLSEEDCSDGHLFANLTLQNGGAESDGIRLVSPDSSYIDTILYDSPNSNFLPDDLHSTGTELCPDVTESHSLARVQNGVDTNEAANWFDCSSPTPGSANLTPVNLGFGTTSVVIQENDVKIRTFIHNLSTTNVYNSGERLEARLDGSLYSSSVISDIQPQDSIIIDVSIHVTVTGAHQVSLFLNINHDISTVDNLWITSIFVGEIPLILNEILYYPSPENQEWIEIYNRGNTDLSLQNLHLKDAAHNEIEFDLEIPAHSFRVLCADSTEFVDKYQHCPISTIVQLDHWVALNNDEETIWLTDDDDKTLDSLHYIGTSQAYDRSLERSNTDSANPTWQICTLQEGGTPGLPNSIIVIETEVYIDSVQIVREGNALVHTIYLAGSEPVQDIHLTCQQFVNSGLGEGIADSYITFPDDSVYIFSQLLPDNGYHAFQYKIEYEDAVAPTSGGKKIVTPPSGGFYSSEYWSFFNLNSLPFVVNEIMYDPLTGTPEWLEIRRNVDLPVYPKLTIHISADSLDWQPDTSEFTVMVHDEADAESLFEQYSLNPDQIVLGLPSLSNTGEAIFISDGFGNLREEFFYDPDWSTEKGVSMERIQPLLLPGADNWSPSLAAAGGTPGQENSVYIQQIPSTTSISISPNPFLPGKQEFCEIQYTFNRAISRISCKVYDLKGRLVRVLADQSLSPAEGSFLWDGKNDASRNLPTGVYIVYFEAYDKDQGHAFHKQNTVVLGN